jgi:putative protease
VNAAATLDHERADGSPASDQRFRKFKEFELIVLARNLAQLEAALLTGASTLYCDFEDTKKYREAVQLVHSASCDQDRTVWVAPPRIFKSGEEWVLKQVRACNADGYLVRNYDHLKFFSECRKIGDFSLNVANAYSADYFMSKYGLERLTASYDLNAEQLEHLFRSAPPEWLEITLHQHMPMFHMEHCVFCAFLSSGTDYTNCGRPCDKHEVRLRDRVGMEHPLKADAGCRNTVFNAQAQTGAEYFERFQSLGARKFRIEFVNESPEQVKQTITEYRKLMRGEITGAQLWRGLKVLNQLGVTRGAACGSAAGSDRALRLVVQSDKLTQSVSVVDLCRSTKCAVVPNLEMLRFSKFHIKLMRRCNQCRSIAAQGQVD